MKRKITVFIAAAATLAIALIAAGCGDSSGGSSHSSGPYGSAVQTGAPSGSVKQPLLGVTRRANGARQVTYGGRLLYRFKGEGTKAFGAGWDVLSPAGKKVESDG